MSTYVIGDIQGCYKPLCKLLEKIAFDPAKDRLWSVGDLVNRGPKPLQTLRFLKELGPAFTAVLGNHDLHLLALYYKAFQGGRSADLKEVLNAPDADILCAWLRHLPLMYQETLQTDFGQENFIMVHAGLAPSWSAEKAKALAYEVESVLRTPQCYAFLAAMYGNKPDTWGDELTGLERLRTITNHFTRIRFCKPGGKMNFSVKTEAETAPAGFRPWYEYQQLTPEHTILFGHWAALNGVTHKPGVYALDTGCVWGRCLSVMRLEDRQRFSVKCKKR